MAKKVIQVPVDEELLKSLEDLAKKERKTRSELIRHACQRYVREVDLEEMDRVYEAGYRKIPEKPVIGEAQLAITGETLPEESW